MFAERVVERVGDVGGAVDLDALSDRELEEVFRQVERERRLADAKMLAVIEVAERRGSFRSDGHRSVSAWCRAAGRWSNAETLSHVRTMKLCRASDVVADAVSSGSIGIAQVAEMARAHANPRCGHELVDIDEVLVRHARHLSFHDFRTVVRRWEVLADSDGAHRDAEVTHRNRNAWINLDGDKVLGRFDGGSLDGVAMREIFDRFCDAEFRTDWDTTVAEHGEAACASLMPRTPAQRRFDALRAIFERAASTAPDARPPDPVVEIVVDIHTLDELIHGEPTLTTRPDDPRQRRCDTPDGTLVTPADALHAAIWGKVRRLVVDSTGVILDRGRTRRLFTGAARDAVLKSSTRCLWPGCDIRSGRCQADHVTAWSHRGPTNIDNGGPDCDHHNTWKHQGYTMHRDQHGYWHTHRPDGTEISPPDTA